MLTHHKLISCSLLSSSALVAFTTIAFLWWMPLPERTAERVAIDQAGHLPGGHLALFVTHRSIDDYVTGQCKFTVANLWGDKLHYLATRNQVETLATEPPLGDLRVIFHPSTMDIETCVFCPLSAKREAQLRKLGHIVPLNEPNADPGTPDHRRALRYITVKPQDTMPGDH